MKPFFLFTLLTLGLNAFSQQPKVEVTVRVIDNNTMEPVRAKVDIFDSTRTHIDTTLLHLKELGKVTFLYPRKKMKYIEVRASGYKSARRPLKDSEELDKLEIIVERIVALGNAYTLPNIYFDKDKSTLDAVFQSEIANMAQILNENPTMLIELQGHTDSTGSEEYNFELSSQRVETVKKYFVDFGIEPDRISTISYGESLPVNLNESSEDRQLNRRVEIVIKSF